MLQKQLKEICSRYEQASSGLVQLTRETANIKKQDSSERTRLKAQKEKLENLCRVLRTENTQLKQAQNGGMATEDAASATAKQDSHADALEADQSQLKHALDAGIVPEDTASASTNQVQDNGIAPEDAVSAGVKHQAQADQAVTEDAGVKNAEQDAQDSGTATEYAISNSATKDPSTDAFKLDDSDEVVGREQGNLSVKAEANDDEPEMPNALALPAKDNADAVANKRLVQATE